MAVTDKDTIMADSITIPHTWYASTIADLQALPVAQLQDGTRVWVDSVQQNFYLSRTTTLVTDGVNVIAPVALAASGVPAGTRWLSSLVAGGVLVSGVSMLVADQATLAAAAFAAVPGVSVTLATGSGSLDIDYDVTGLATTGAAQFRVVIDGVEALVGAVPVSRSNLPVVATAVSAGASCRISGLTAGSHTVALQYQVAGGGNLAIRPATQPEHATLRVAEAALV